jgi:indole-3-glycerol phosphate synthase
VPTGLLDDLLAGALEDADRRRLARPLLAVESAALAAPRPVDALQRLAPRDRVHVIAEIKRASPSRGAMAAIADPAGLARAYEEGGASAISVLTEGRRFGGSLEDLRAVHAATTVPLLRKDFVGDEYQVLEAREAGASIVLLIVAALDQARLTRLHAFIRDLDMTPLVETHSDDELSRAIDLEARLIGVNARDLDTFELDTELFGRLAPRIPEGVIKVAESAVRSPADVARYRAAGADAVLVGEALVTGGDPAAAVTAYLEV